MPRGTSIPFITSDQPTLNVLGGMRDDIGPEHLAPYYPLSPKYALLFDDAHTPSLIGEVPMTEEAVTMSNRSEVRVSRRQVFAHCEPGLAPYLVASGTIATDLAIGEANESVGNINRRFVEEAESILG
jgi:hypothetical protein